MIMEISACNIETRVCHVSNEGIIIRQLDNFRGFVPEMFIHLFIHVFFGQLSFFAIRKVFPTNSFQFFRCNAIHSCKDPFFNCFHARSNTIDEHCGGETNVSVNACINNPRMQEISRNSSAFQSSCKFQCKSNVGTF